jgi:hypothetical protein
MLFHESTRQQHGYNFIRVTTLLLVVCLGVSFLIGDFALGRIPDSVTNLISACYAKDGVLHVIDSQAGNVCAQKETLLSWNQAGPAGPQGPQGLQGPPGPPGTPGAAPTSTSFDVPISDPAVEQSVISVANIGKLTVSCVEDTDRTVGGIPFAIFYYTNTSPSREAVISSERPEGVVLAPGDQLQVSAKFQPGPDELLASRLDGGGSAVHLTYGNAVERNDPCHVVAQAIA